MSPDYEIVPIVPENAESGVSNTLWTPTNVQYIHSWLVGRSTQQEAGNIERVWKHEFALTHMGQTKYFGVLAEESASDKQIEDLAAFTSERTMRQIEIQVQVTNGRLRPEDLAERKNWQTRRDLAGAWRQYRRWAKKRRASTTGRTIYKGVN